MDVTAEANIIIIAAHEHEHDSFTGAGAGAEKNPIRREVFRCLLTLGDVKTKGNMRG